MKASNTRNVKNQGNKQLRLNKMLKTILLYISFSVASVYHEWQENLDQLIQDYEKNMKTHIDAYSELKAFNLRCNTDKIENVEDFIKTILNHTDKNKKEKISMMMSNRNYMKLHTVENKLLIFDLAFKCIDTKKDIFSENIFVINDISQINEINYNKFIVDRIKHMNNQIDILFFDEFSLLNHHLLVNQLFQYLEWDLADSTYLVFYYLITDNLKIEEYVNSILSLMKDKFPACFIKTKGETHQVRNDKNEYMQPSRIITNGYFESHTVTHRLCEDRLIGRYIANGITKNGQIENITYRDKFKSMDIIIYKELKTKKSASSNLDPLNYLDKNLCEKIIITQRFNYFKRYFSKSIKFNFETNIIPNTNWFNKQVIIREQNTMGENEFDNFPVNNINSYEYVVDENDEVPNCENYLKHKQTQQDYLDAIQRIKLNLNKYYKPYNLFKTCFYLTDKNWMDNECILLQGKKFYFLVEFKDFGLEYIEKQNARIKNCLSKQQNARINDFIFDINPYYINNFNEYFENEHKGEGIFVNLAINEEFTKIQKKSKLKGIVYSQKGEHYENNYYICLIPYAILDKKFFNAAKAVKFFNEKLSKLWEVNSGAMSHIHNNFFLDIINHERIQNIPKEPFKYAHLTDAKMLKYIDHDLKLIFLEKQESFTMFQRNRLIKSDTLSLQNTAIKDIIAPIILLSLKESIDELYQFSFDTNLMILILSEYDYINNEFDMIVNECKKVFNVSEN